jgi:hypothetical protein
MRWERTALLLALLALAGCAGEETKPGGGSALDPGVVEERARLRALGKAFYENPATRAEAVDVLHRAWKLDPDSSCDHANYGLALLRAGREDEGIAELERVQVADPRLPHTWFNLGIAYKTSDPRRARVQFERMVELVPDEAVSHYNLGLLLKVDGELDAAISQFELAEASAPHLTGPPFQLAATLRQLGRPEESAAAMERFRAIREATENAAVPEDLEWGYYAELCDPIDALQAPEAMPPTELVLEPQTLTEGLAVDGAHLELVDLTGDGRLEVLLLAGSRIHLYDAEGASLDGELTALDAVTGFATGDADGDGRTDVAVTGGGGAALFLQRAGTLRRDESAADSWPAGRYRSPLWIDFDHDYDLDLLLLGADPRLLRNDGAPLSGDVPSWSDRSAGFPFAPGEAVAAALFDLEPDSQGRDVVTATADGRATLYRDRLAGRYDRVDLPALPPGTLRLAAGDLDRDSRTDLVALGRAGLVWLRNTGGSVEPRPWSQEPTSVFAWVDLQNRGRADLLTVAGIRRGVEPGGELGPADFPGAVPGIAALAVGDLDADGRQDLVVLGEDGVLRRMDNRSEPTGHFVAVSLEGRKNLPLSPQAIVEIKAARHYQKQIYRGRPLHFGLGAEDRVDVVRVTWANGLVQNETQVAVDGGHHFVEAQRLSGSCPMIYTWDGEGFRFITDVLGVAPLGASSGDGETFPVDHDEHIQIPGAALVERDGALEIRIVEELREVAYLDQVVLIAADRPQEVDLFVGDKFQGPPFPHHLELYGARRRLRPVRAVDENGRDVLDRVLAADRRYPDGFARTEAGVAELHRLELDFGPVAAGNDAVLVLSGWVDWADGSTFLATSQHPEAGLVFPYLEVLDERGEWHPAIPDMGMPAGKPKTIVVDLRGRFLSPARSVRITSSVAVYWDEAFLVEEADDPPVRLTRLTAATATLGFGGFSRAVIHPQRKQPETFVYAERSPTSMWNPTPGLYTRYGAVDELLEAVDDRFVIMGSGDEVRLLFPAAKLPQLPPNWRRDWILAVDGWAKDGDANTIHSQTVEPLPFHGMPAYPYPEPFAYPDTPEHRVYRETYLTRPGLVLNRPLVDARTPAPPVGDPSTTPSRSP